MTEPLRLRDFLSTADLADDLQRRCPICGCVVYAVPDEDLTAELVAAPGLDGADKFVWIHHECPTPDDDEALGFGRTLAEFFFDLMEGWQSSRN